jgi:hypothetical protein
MFDFRLQNIKNQKLIFLRKEIEDKSSKINFHQ